MKSAAKEVGSVRRMDTVGGEHPTRRGYIAARRARIVSNILDTTVHESARINWGNLH
jgi:hypothetical protein